METRKRYLHSGEIVVVVSPNDSHDIYEDGPGHDAQVEGASNAVIANTENVGIVLGPDSPVQADKMRAAVCKFDAHSGNSTSIAIKTTPAVAESNRSGRGILDLNSLSRSVYFERPQSASGKAKLQENLCRVFDSRSQSDMDLLKRALADRVKMDNDAESDSIVMCDDDSDDSMGDGRNPQSDVQERQTIHHSKQHPVIVSSSAEGTANIPNIQGPPTECVSSSTVASGFLARRPAVFYGGAISSDASISTAPEGTNGFRAGEDINSAESRLPVSQQHMPQQSENTTPQQHVSLTQQQPPSQCLKEQRVSSQQQEASAHQRQESSLQQRQASSRQQQQAQLSQIEHPENLQNHHYDNLAGHYDNLAVHVNGRLFLMHEKLGKGGSGQVFRAQALPTTANVVESGEVPPQAETFRPGIANAAGADSKAVEGDDGGGPGKLDRIQDYSCYALKVARAKSEFAFKMLEQEVKLLELCRGENNKIIQMLDYEFGQGRSGALMIMEMATGGDLAGFLKRHRTSLQLTANLSKWKKKATDGYDCCEDKAGEAVVCKHEKKAESQQIEKCEKVRKEEEKNKITQRWDECSQREEMSPKIWEETSIDHHPKESAEEKSQKSASKSIVENVAVSQTGGRNGEANTAAEASESDALTKTSKENNAAGSQIILEGQSAAIFPYVREEESSDSCLRARKSLGVQETEASTRRSVKDGARLSSKGGGVSNEDATRSRLSLKSSVKDEGGIVKDEGATVNDEGVTRCRRLRSLFLEICECVQSLHSKNIIHADLKPANFLLCSSYRKDGTYYSPKEGSYYGGGQCLKSRQIRDVSSDIVGSNRETVHLDAEAAPSLKVADLGLSDLVPEGASHVSRRNLLGTLQYMAPEAVFHTPHANPSKCKKTNAKKTQSRIQTGDPNDDPTNANPKSLNPEENNENCKENSDSLYLDRTQIQFATDIWSIGVIFYEMLYGCTPFVHLRHLGPRLLFVIRLGNSVVQFHPPGTGVDSFRCTPRCVQEFERLVQICHGCLQRKPNNRWTIGRIMEELHRDLVANPYDMNQSATLLVRGEGTLRNANEGNLASVAIPRNNLTKPGVSPKLANLNKFNAKLAMLHEPDIVSGKPELQQLAQICQNLVQQRGRVEKWTLGRIVEELHRDFVRCPPNLEGQADNSSNEKGSLHANEVIPEAQRDNLEGRSADLGDMSESAFSVASKVRGSHGAMDDITNMNRIRPVMCETWTTVTKQSGEEYHESAEKKRHSTAHINGGGVAGDNLRAPVGKSVSADERVEEDGIEGQNTAESTYPETEDKISNAEKGASQQLWLKEAGPVVQNLPTVEHMVDISHVTADSVRANSARTSNVHAPHAPSNQSHSDIIAFDHDSVLVNTFENQTSAAAPLAIDSSEQHVGWWRKLPHASRLWIYIQASVLVMGAVFALVWGCYSRPKEDGTLEKNHPETPPNIEKPTSETAVDFNVVPTKFLQNETSSSGTFLAESPSDHIRNVATESPHLPHSPTVDITRLNESTAEANEKTRNQAKKLQIGTLGDKSRESALPTGRVARWLAGSAVLGLPVLAAGLYGGHRLFRKRHVEHVSSGVSQHVYISSSFDAMPTTPHVRDGDQPQRNTSGHLGPSAQSNRGPSGTRDSSNGETSHIVPRSLSDSDSVPMEATKSTTDESEADASTTMRTSDAVTRDSSNGETSDIAPRSVSDSVPVEATKSTADESAADSSTTMRTSDAVTRDSSNGETSDIAPRSVSDSVPVEATKSTTDESAAGSSTTMRTTGDQVVSDAVTTAGGQSSQSDLATESRCSKRPDHLDEVLKRQEEYKKKYPSMWYHSAEVPFWHCNDNHKIASLGVLFSGTLLLFLIWYF